MARHEWLLAGLVVCWASLAVAQENRDPAVRDRNDPVRTDKDVLRTGQVDPDTNAPVFRAKNLIGYKVKNRQGEDLGKIEELAIDPQSGQIAYAVLSFGGFLGLGDKLFAIPWNALDLRPSEEVFILNVDKEQLKNAPGFDKDKWPDMADRRWGEGVHGFYGARPYWEGSQRVMRDPGLIGKAGETHKLPLKIEKGKTYAFVATPMGTAGHSSSASRSSTGAEGQGHRTGDLMKSHIYRVRVQDTSSSGDSTLLVSVEPGDSLNPTQVDERDTSRSTTESRAGAGSKSFTVVVEQDGRVKSMRPEGAAVTTPPGSSTAGSGQFSEAECSTHLQVVLGSGLHQQPLEVGKFYPASQLFRSTLASEPSRSGTTEALPNCQLRFDGKTRGTNGDIARFTVFSTDSGLLPSSSRGTPGTSEGTQAERRGDTSRDTDPARAGSTRALAGGERPVGEIAYRMDDGILEHLNIQKSASAADTTSPQQAKFSQGFSVRRIEAGSR